MQRNKKGTEWQCPFIRKSWFNKTYQGLSIPVMFCSTPLLHEKSTGVI